MQTIEKQIETSEYTVEEVANYFIEKGIEENNPVNPMKLQKLLYFAYGWYLVYFEGKKLFNQTIQAWRYGPVVESIYHEVKSYGNYPITSPITSFLFGSTSVIGIKWHTPKIKFKDKDDEEFLDTIWKVYSKFSALQLSTMTHADNTPWKKVAEKYENTIPNNAVLEDSLIKECFESYKKANEVQGNS
jgi:uncharacterized phage-associated protein